MKLRNGFRLVGCVLFLPLIAPNPPGRLLPPKLHLQFNERVSQSASDTLAQYQGAQPVPVGDLEMLANAVVANLLELRGTNPRPKVKNLGFSFTSVVWPVGIRQGFERVLQIGSPVRITNIPEPVSEGALAYTYCKWQGERKPIEGLGRPCSTGNSVHVMVMAAGGATLHGMVFYQRKGQPSYMDAKLERFPGVVEDCCKARLPIYSSGSTGKMDLTKLAYCVQVSDSQARPRKQEGVIRGVAAIPSYGAANEERHYGMSVPYGYMLIESFEVEVQGPLLFGTRLPAVPEKFTITFISSPGSPSH